MSLKKLVLQVTWETLSTCIGCQRRLVRRKSRKRPRRWTYLSKKKNEKDPARSEAVVDFAIISVVVLPFFFSVVVLKVHMATYIVQKARL